MLRQAPRLIVLVVIATGLLAGQDKPKEGGTVIILGPGPEPKAPADASPRRPHLDLEGRSGISDGTKMILIQAINAEFARTRKTMPLGSKNLAISPEGEVRPGDARLHQDAFSSGAAAKIGDRIQITNVYFHERTIYFEVNGGPKKKTKWYQHITISAAGGSTNGPDPNQGAATGAAFTLEFKKHVPEMSGEELKQLLDPVLDFGAKTKEEVFLETIPPKVKEAVKKHDVMVGMDRDLVLLAIDRPRQKVREKDDDGKEYEEWIYGWPPQDVVFVRFVGDEVTQVKTAKVGGQIIVKNQKEVDVTDGVVTLASVKPVKTAKPAEVAAEDTPEPQKPAQRPTLRKAGEGEDPAVAKQKTAGSGSGRDEPEWGTGKKPPPQDQEPPPR
ncbi:MAG TPA: hypothetical protein VEW69_00580 [Alphaproteobacteria bacterium]|nr:hypothetical protein [Alphaproteobacteria bacterium]